MASPQIEDGFTRVANELLEEIFSRPFTGMQLRLLLWITRMSYGYHEHWTPSGYGPRGLARATKSDHTAAMRAGRELRNAAVVRTDPAGRWMINKDHDQWGIRPGGSSSTEQPGGAQGHQVVRLDTGGVVSPRTKSGAPKHQKWCSQAPAYKDKERKKERKNNNNNNNDSPTGTPGGAPGHQVVRLDTAPIQQPPLAVAVATPPLPAPLVSTPPRPAQEAIRASQPRPASRRAQPGLPGLPCGANARALVAKFAEVRRVDLSIPALRDRWYRTHTAAAVELDQLAGGDLALARQAVTEIAAWLDHQVEEHQRDPSRGIREWRHLAAVVNNYTAWKIEYDRDAAGGE